MERQKIVPIEMQLAYNGHSSSHELVGDEYELSQIDKKGFVEDKVRVTSIIYGNNLGLRLEVPFSLWDKDNRPGFYQIS